MPRRQSKEQKRIVGRAMREFKQGGLRQGGSGRKVRNPKQAIAIGLSEAGASNRQSPKENSRRLKESRSKSRRGATAEAASKRGGSARPSGPAKRGERAEGRSSTKAELMNQARRRNIPGRSRMSKGELERALQRA